MILDTNAVSAWANNEAALLAALRNDQQWYLPSIVLGEYRYGIGRSTKREELEIWIEETERVCIVLTPDAVTARHYAELRRHIELAGFEVPYHDIWIGALAVQNNRPVVTRDAHFDRMPGVTRISW